MHGDVHQGPFDIDRIVAGDAELAARHDQFRKAVEIAAVDEAALRVAVAKVLRKKGYVVIEAEDGSSGVDLFRDNASVVDMVLLDLTLPGKSGREVLAELRQIQPDVRVVITSAYGHEKVMNSLEGLHPWLYIQKPYQLSSLLQILSEQSMRAVARSRTAAC